VILFLHNRYRTTGGEERVVGELLALVRGQLGEPAELLERDSASLGRAWAAAGLLGGGLRPREVADAVRLSGARAVHAHNLQPAFGWRGLAAARRAGARVVVHLHQYRLVCANGVCFTHGEECTRCHGRNTLPGVVLGCRGGRAEGAVYGAGLALWQRRLAEHADAIIVPSAFARERLRELGAPLDWDRVYVMAPPVARVDLAHGGPGGGASTAPAGDDRTSSRRRGSATGEEGGYALVVSRLAPEKGVDVAIDACMIAGVPLVVAGEGPELAKLLERARGAQVRFAGRVENAELARLRAGAALAIVPSRSAETFGLAAAEAMAAGVPVLASRVGALPELVEPEGLVQAGDAPALAEAIGRRLGDASAGERGRVLVEEMCSPRAVAGALAAIYDGLPFSARPGARTPGRG
jgi:glycosyltransferase involved in cell wall biosynthesis